MALVRHAGSPNWYMSFMINGKAYFRSTKTTNKSLAAKIEQEARKEILQGFSETKAKEFITLQALIDYYLATKDVNQSHDAMLGKKLLGSKRNKTTGKMNKCFGFDPEMLFDQMTEKDLFTLVVNRKKEGNSTTTIIKELHFINGLLKLARSLGMQVPNIDPIQFREQQKIKPTKKPLRYLTEQEERRLLEELHPDKELKGLAPVAEQAPLMRRMRVDAYEFVIVLLDLGARYSEVAELTWDQIDVETKEVRLIRTKVGNESILMMTERAHAIFKRRSENKDHATYVFPNKNLDGPRGYAPKAFQTAMKNAGIEDCSFHTLRKTLATKLVRKGVAISDVSAILGHSSVTTTESYYASLAPSEASRRAVKVLNNLV